MESENRKPQLILYFVIISTFTFLCLHGSAQINTYTFATGTGASLENMASSTTLISSGNDDGVSAVTNIGFNFSYNGTTYTQFSVNSNGLMRLGGTVVSNQYTNVLADGNDNPKIAPHWDDLSTATNGKVHYKSFGSAPNRYMVVEWLVYNTSSVTSAYNTTFQAILYESTNALKFIYGTCPSGISYSIGLTTSLTDYIRVNGTTHMSATSGTSDSQTAAMTSGRYYSFTPVTMAFSSSTVVQSSTATVSRCGVDQSMVCVQVVTTGTASPLSLTQFQLGMGGGTSTLTAHVSEIHVYYTGTTNTFSATGEFLTGGTVPTGNSNTINGSQTLSPGTNYFWIAYDINQSASIGDLVDASCTQITVAGLTRTPTATSPAGTRTISSCIPGPGGITSGLAVWLKPSAGLTISGVNVTGWADQSPATTSVTVNGSPDYVSSGYNNNPYIDFTKSSGTGGDYLSIPTQDFQSFFWVAKLNDLTRTNTHLATWDQVTFSGPPANGTLHGATNAGAAAYCDVSYDAGFSGAGVWRKNGTATGISPTTNHSGNFDIVSALGTDVTTIDRIMGGQASNSPFDARTRDWYGPVGEVLLYTNAVSTTQANKIESYLAIKYGITLGANASTTLAYTSPAGATVWTGNTGYHYDVTGIAKDNALEALDQKKSQSINSGSTMPFTIAHSSISSPTSLTADNVYIMVGHNNGSVTSNLTVSYTHAGAAIKKQLSRIWRIQTTNLPGGRASNELEVQFDMSNVPGLMGGTGLGSANSATDLRLILDDNTTFGQGTVNESSYSYSSVSGNLINFRIPFSALPATGAYFFSIGSTNLATAPLPVELTDFSAQCVDTVVRLNWTTATERMNNYFTIQRSQDTHTYTNLNNVNGAGNSSTPINYSCEDKKPLHGLVYYRLKQTDFNGTEHYWQNITVENCKKNQELTVYPNPFQNIFNISGNRIGSDADFSVELMDVFGRKIIIPYKTESAGEGSFALSLDMSGQPCGVYMVKTIINGKTSCTRLIKQ